MRKLSKHIVDGDSVNHLAEIQVLDEPGHGGACHRYKIDYVNGAPTSGGLETFINFQNGPIKEVGINGNTHEEFLAILIDRMEGFQAGPYACDANAIALAHLENALGWLQLRTRERISRNVEGTHAQ